MIVHDVKQGSVEWMQARLGLPTASQFDRIITPVRRNPSGARDTYRAELLAEWLLGQPIEWGTSGWMERGMEMEDEARKWYAFEKGVDVETVGFVTNDDGRVGGSPDGLVGTDGVLEIKCLSPKNHVLAMLGEHDSHIGQINGYLWLTRRDWADLCFYHPDLPPVVHRMDRDDEYLGDLLPVLEKFTERLEADKERLSEHRVLRPWHPELQEMMREANAPELAEAV